MIRRPPRSTLDRSSAASDVYKRQAQEDLVNEEMSEIAKLKAELNEMRDKYLRIYAEFDNFKKRTSKERIDLIKNAAQDTLTALLLSLIHISEPTRPY